MDRIGVKNFRSLKEVYETDIKPITVLVGKNSSGKSSFIRIIPLIKQSIETKISDPLLWYGNYVDLGDFEECLSKNKNIKKDDIEFIFEMKTDANILRNVHRYRASNNLINDIKIKVTMAICQNQFKRVEIQYCEQLIQIIYGKNDIVSNITINGSRIYDELVPSKKYIRTDNSLIPNILFENGAGYPYRTLGYWGPSIFEKKLIEKLKEKAHKSTSEEKLYKLVGHAKIGTKESVLSFLKQKKFPNKLNEEIQKLEINDDFFMEINNIIVADVLPEIIAIVNIALRIEMNSVKYIKPIRAMVERYYRVQGLSINELDSAGENLPMLLHSLKQEQRKKFEKWVSSRFGVSFTLSDNKGHISLLLKDEETKDTYNLADVGYGYSQVLPILMQIWLTFFSNDRKTLDIKNKITIIIEQPELHLHPAFQAKIIDVFAEMLEEARRVNCELKIIFETHSETMVQRLGYLIAKGYLKNEDVNILLFDKYENETKITSKNFTRDGVLKEWPIGFFTPGKKVNRNDNRD